MNEKKAKVIKANKQLQQKVGTGSIDEKKIEKAQEVIETNEVDFKPIAMPLLNQLQDAVTRAKQGMLDQKAMVEEITQPIMNLKGNAAVFKFPLVSEMTSTVLTLIEHVKRVDEEIVSICENLHKAVTVAVAQDFKDKSNPVAAQLVNEFQGVCRRYMDKRV